MKTLKIGGFECYLLEEALKMFKKKVVKQKFPEHSVVTKDYVLMMITQLEEALQPPEQKQK